MIKQMLVTLTIVCTSNFTYADDWTGRDKQKHLLAGAAVASILTLHTKNESVGFVAGASIGIAKELYDASGKGDPSFKDLAVTALGAYIGAKTTGLFFIPKKKGVEVAYSAKF